ncbi:MAG: glycosyltransferase, partial [Chloroflexi bacterium]|nr:glycosyltransferase [Chloroflexota bacterium]
MPSRLDEPPTGVASTILVVEPGDPGVVDAAAAAARHAPAGVDLVVVGDGIDDAGAAGIRGALAASQLAEGDREVVRTRATLGRAAALNAGIRRCRAPIVVVLDTSIEPTGDLVTPLVHALADPSVAVAGPFGLATSDLRRFEEVVAMGGSPAATGPLDAAATQG